MSGRLFQAAGPANAKARLPADPGAPGKTAIVNGSNSSKVKHTLHQSVTEADTIFIMYILLCLTLCSLDSVKDGDERCE